MHPGAVIAAATYTTAGIAAILEAERIRSTLSTPFCRLITTAPAPRCGASAFAAFFGVDGLDAEQHNIGIPRGAFAGRRLYLNVLLEIHAVEKQAVAGDGFDMPLAADQGDRRSGARQHPAKVGAYGAGAQYGNTRPRILHGHIV